MSSINTVVPQPLPSLTPSPIEEDLTRARTSWSEEDSSDSESSEERRKKGKERQVETEYPGENSDVLQDTSAGGYPPMNDDAADTRRVEENLKRWEVAERLRRKAARENSSNTPSASLVGDVTRRASLLWPGRRQHPPSRSGLGNHTALRSRESVDVIPLDSIPASTPPSPTPDENHPSNPFSNPSAPSSPFDDSQQQTALMTPSDPPPDVTEDEYAASEQPALVVPASVPIRPPPPRPLGLPKPRTPPPPIDSPHTNRAPQAHPPPVVAQTSPNLEGETRWWHDWLCGCGEGPDRGGDNQAGRTNPFE